MKINWKRRRDLSPYITFVDDIDPKRVCRDEDCPLVDLHVAHAGVQIVGRAKRAPKPEKILREMFFALLPRRGYLPAQDAHAQIRSEYGSVSDRQLYRVFGQLEERGLVMRKRDIEDHNVILLRRLR